MDGSLPIRFASGLDSFARVKLEQLALTKQPIELKNQVLIIGAFDDDSNDSHPITAHVSEKKRMPGTLTIANAVNTLLRNNWIKGISDFQLLFVVAFAGIASYRAGSFCSGYGEFVAGILLALATLQVIALWSNVFVLFTPILVQGIAQFFLGRRANARLVTPVRAQR